MTEVPEHLLRKARERRAELTGEGGDAPAEPAAETPAVATPAAAPAAAAASVPAEPAAPEPPKPLAPYVEAAINRKKIPLWIVPVLIAIPLWAWAYVFTLQSPAETNAVLETGSSAYVNNALASCSGCHGATGGGGVGYALADGEVTLTFPGVEGIATQMNWIVRGTDNWAPATIGDPDRAGGAHATGGQGNMPGFGTELTLMELVGVTLHERTAWHSGPEVDAEIALSDTLLELEEAGELMFLGEAVTFETQLPADVLEVDYESEFQALIGQAQALLTGEGEG